MSGSSIEFYADEKDLAFLFSKFKELYEYKYIQSLSALNSDNIETKQPSELLGFLVSKESPVQANVFFCTEINTELNITPINMKTEQGIKYRVAQLFNPDGAEILLGGQVDEMLIITSTIRTTGETSVAKKIFKNLKAVVLKNAKKVKSFYVMPSAFEKFSAGVRLAQGRDFHPDCDLKLD